MPPLKRNPLDAARKVAADAARERSEITDVLKRLDMLNRAVSQMQQEIAQLGHNLNMMYGLRGGQPSGERLDELSRRGYLSVPDPRLDNDIPY